MTREEAIKILKDLSDCSYIGSLASEDIEALKMSIKALEQEPTTKNDLAVDKEQLKTMIRGLTKWYVKRDNTEVGEPNTAVGLLYDDVMFGIDRLPSVTLIRPKGHWIPIYQGDEIIDYRCSECEFGNTFGRGTFGMDFCPRCGSYNREAVEK